MFTNAPGLSEGNVILLSHSEAERVEGLADPHAPATDTPQEVGDDRPALNRSMGKHVV